MAYKTGKEQYTQDEIIEILKRNVALYKDEKEFVDYIVELAMFLIDRHYDPAGPRAAAARERVDAAVASLPPAPPRKGRKGSPLPEGEQPPPRASELRRRHQYDIDPLEDYLHTVPPPFGGSAPPAPPPSSPAAAGKEPPPPRPPVPPELDPDLDDGEPTAPPRKSGEVFQVKGGLTTPPEGPQQQRKPARPDEPSDEELGRVRQINVESLGRARVYRVVRSYKSPTAFESPCPVCGGMVPQEHKRCPNCGHLM